MKIIIDSREKKYSHLTKFFDAKKIQYEVRALKSGDYAVEIDGKLQPIIVERKNSLDELCGNFTKNRDRFRREFERAPDVVKILLIENSRYEDILEGNYKSKMSPQALLSSLLSFQWEFDLRIFFISKKYSGSFIANTFNYYLRNLEKEKKYD